MAIRKSYKEDLFISKNINDTMICCRDALENGNFTKIKCNNLLNQLTANYKKITIWGEIIISLVPEGNGTKIDVNCIANIDNIYALFKSPGKTILENFKKNIKEI